jgi:arsenate reductase (thioredoxin)
MAESLLNVLRGDAYEVSSAGIEPTSVHEYAIKAMNEIGIDISHNRSKSADQFEGMEFDYVVTVCDNAREACPFFPYGKQKLHKGFRDPASAKGTAEDQLQAFREIRDEIKAWIQETF